MEGKKFLIQPDCTGSVSVAGSTLIAYDYPCALPFTDTG